MASGFIDVKLDRDIFILNLLFWPLEYVLKYTRYVGIEAPVAEKSIYWKRPALLRLKIDILVKYTEIYYEIIRWQHHTFVWSVPNACWQMPSHDTC